MMTKTHTRGFTLIELLVVIAIIGILASVVLASLNSARAKGSDAAIESSINNARAQAELYYDNHNPHVYTGLCADSVILNVQTSVNNAGGSFSCDDSSPDAYRISSSLVASTTGHYCVDSTGKAKTGAAPSGTACP